MNDILKPMLASLVDAPHQDPRLVYEPKYDGIRKPELDMAKALVNSLAADWDPAKYTDQYRENLLRIIKGKMKGKKVELEPTAEPRQAEVVDLMERLRRSLEQGAARGGSKAAVRPKTRARGWIGNKHSRAVAVRLVVERLPAAISISVID